MDLKKAFRLSHSALSPQIDPEKITKLMQADIDESVNFIGQERAQQALEFGLDMDMTGYNLFVMGEPATGRHTLIDNHLKLVAAKKETPHEWCYVNNFDENRSPNYVRLAPGESKQFVKDIESLIDELFDTFPAAFDNPAYQRKKRAIEREFNDKYEQALEKVEKRALENNVVLYEEKGAVSFAPVINGKPVSDSDFAQLDEEQRQHFYDLISDLEIFLNETLLELPKWKREASEQQRSLAHDTIESALRPLLKDLEHQYASELGVVKFIREMKATVIELIQEWLADEADEEKGKEDIDVRQIFEDQLVPNILFNMNATDGAPIIYEPNPSFQNIFGRIEYSSVQGSVYTSYRMIRPGALHRANGGYLLIEADKLMQQPAVWETLKLALKSQQIKMESPTGEANIVNASTLSPQSIPLEVKVILMGSRELYYVMQEYDNEFNELFRVLADFEHYIGLSEKVQFGFIQKIRQYVEKQGLEISDDAVTQLMLFSFRQAEHQHKLSARFADVLELIGESKFYASKDNATMISQQHVLSSLQGKQYRTGQISESFLEDIQEGQILIDTEGFEVGKVNGLTVLEIGDTAFGTPARISATVYAGSNGIVDIEREVELGKAIHSKGVMLLNGYLGNKYAQDFNLCFSANIAIEQSYGHIDGDSASLGEVCALISAVTHIPINQSLAITGSINQHGQVQSVGGVNEKIEGYFKLCKARRLTGEQGVIIPATNAINLVLNDEVKRAVEAGQFHIYAVKKVDDALSILMNKVAGELSSRGRYPRDSINGIASSRLRVIANIVNGEEAE
jgi:lon-related putative ATP-dependent protease